MELSKEGRGLAVAGTEMRLLQKGTALGIAPEFTYRAKEKLKKKLSDRLASFTEYLAERGIYPLISKENKTSERHKQEKQIASGNKTQWPGIGRNSEWIHSFTGRRYDQSSSGKVATVEGAQMKGDASAIGRLRRSTIQVPGQYYLF